MLLYLLLSINMSAHAFDTTEIKDKAISYLRELKPRERYEYFNKIDITVYNMFIKVSFYKENKVSDGWVEVIMGPELFLTSDDLSFIRLREIIREEPLIDFSNKNEFKQKIETYFKEKQIIDNFENFTFRWSEINNENLFQLWRKVRGIWQGFAGRHGEYDETLIGEYYIDHENGRIIDLGTDYLSHDKIDIGRELSQ